MTKAAESDHATASDVIPMVKKLRLDIIQLTASGIGTLKDECLKNIDK